MTQPVDPDISGAARGYWSLQIRAAQFIQMLLDQQETDNGVRPWMTKERIADDLGVTTRTITEMMSRLRELGVPANYVRKREGIGFTAKVTSFPALVCTQHESMGLCIAMLGLSVHSSMPYTAGVRSIAIKLTAGLRKELAVEFEALESAISFHCIGADIFIRPINFEVVTPAIIYRQELQIEYAKPSEGGLDDGARDSEPGRRRIEPLHLACIDFGWYLLAWDPKDEMVKTFALRRIRDIRMTGITCPPREFDAKKQLRHCFGAFGGKKAETVRLRFWGRAASVIPEFLWHRSQKISPVPDKPGMIDLTMKVYLSPRVRGWICEWLGQVAVLEPKGLRDEVEAMARKGAEDQVRVGAEWDAGKS